MILKVIYIIYMASSPQEDGENNFLGVTVENLGGGKAVLGGNVAF